MATVWHTILSGMQRVSSARPIYAVAALGLYVVSLWIVGARWRRFLAALGGRIGVSRAVLATVGGIAAGNLTPSSRLAGEACRIALGRLGGTVSWQQATLATVWDRLSELPAIIVLGAMAAVALHNLAGTARSVALVVGLIGIAVGGAVLIRAIRRSSVRLGGWRERLALDAISGRVFAAGVGYSLLLWLQDYARLTCVMLAFGVSLLPTQTAALSIVAMLGGLVPALAGLGPVEGGLVAGLVAFGVDLPTAAAITATERLISYAFSTSVGVAVIALVGGRSLWSGRRMLGALARPAS
jgi:uncharacterized membrane protein YbhN (UPF0104 family)